MSRTNSEAADSIETAEDVKNENAAEGSEEDGESDKKTPLSDVLKRHPSQDAGFSQFQ